MIFSSTLYDMILIDLTKDDFSNIYGDIFPASDNEMKSDNLARSLAMMEDELKRAEERVKIAEERVSCLCIRGYISENIRGYLRISANIWESSCSLVGFGENVFWCLSPMVRICTVCMMCKCPKPNAAWRCSIQFDCRSWRLRTSCLQSARTRSSWRSRRRRRGGGRRSTRCHFEYFWTKGQREKENEEGGEVPGAILKNFKKTREEREKGD